MRARVSWTLVLAAFLALPPFQRERVDEMGFGQVFRIERMRVDPTLTQALRSRWDTEANAFAFTWGHMIPSLEDVSRITGLRVYGRAVSGYTYPCYHDLVERLLDLPVERRSSLVGKNAGETEDEYLERLARVSRRELASEPGPQAVLDLRRFLVLFLGRLLFATRGDAVHCRFLPLLEDLGEVGGYAWGAAFLAHQFDGLSASERQTSTSGFYPFLQVWDYLHLPAMRRGELTRSGLVPIAHRWDSRRGTRHLADQLEHLQEALDSYPYLDVVWQPYLGEGDEGQPWLVQARPYFGRSVWLHALNLVLPLNLFLTQRSLGLRQSVVEFPMNIGVPHPRVSTIYREFGLGRHPEVLEGREGNVSHLPRINLPPEVIKLLFHTCPFRQEVGRRMDVMRWDKGAWLLKRVRPLARERGWFGRVICSGRRPRPNLSWGEVAWF
ncbi:hypothetical protein Taro_050429 [Colocasia esculenta]|uniref:Aminotransferase-like plant mobile domain-containing protein n=1 Tax=Colocasia esculenta TaxID=4460 RepID=A0A843XE40_COLES|nr:hypothetical protein [Colocasia esculenta]